MALQQIDFTDLHLNPMTLFANEWAALVAGNEQRGYNAMTIGWGHLGAIWDTGETQVKTYPTVCVYVRPQRYTKQFMDRETSFTVDFLGAERRRELAYLGAKSGRDENKVAKLGLTPVFDEECETTYLAESRLVLVCRKLYEAPLVEKGFTNKATLERNYPLYDFHTMYIGEIVKVLWQAPDPEME